MISNPESEIVFTESKDGTHNRTHQNAEAARLRYSLDLGQGETQYRHAEFERGILIYGAEASAADWKG